MEAIAAQLSNAEAAAGPAEPDAPHWTRFRRPAGALEPAPTFAGLWPFDLEVFFSEYWSRRPVIVRGEAADLAGLLSWDAINRMLYSRKLEDMHLRLVRHGRKADPGSYTTRYHARGGGRPRTRIDPVRCSRLLRDGHTLVIDEVDPMHPPIDALACSFEDALGEKVQVNLFADWTRARGFDVHWDDCDVYVLQLAGRKRWRLYEKVAHVRSFRNAPGEERPPETEVWQGVLEAGDLLYLPRGLWHAAESDGRESLHLSFTTECRTGYHFLQWLTESLLEEEVVRRNVPFHAGEEALAAYGDDLAAAVAARLDAGVLTEYRARVLANLRHRRPHNLPVSASGAAALSDDTLLSWRAYSASPVEVDGDTFTLACHGKTYRFSSASLPIVETLRAASPLTLREVVEKTPLASREQVAQLSAQLACLGLVETTAREAGA